ncbi:3'(2'),5'-bisphosphate nucleotidase CysQ family protein [Deinococcus pimensis]|uniref:3'(2'),5'-bisphosphate nucleotidase CysQ family protein n=1 Tax=Deinococcus pimensis TaxID=309888 RepID=UPI0005EBBA17|nr:3'(2'),5'-bisphosphate nucleotidase CysQ [Deinococcus pimensis]
MTDAAPDLQRELDVATRLARQAGELLLEHVRRGFAVEEKTPDDPVTIADREASELIVAGLRAAFPDDGILSEEEADSAERLGRRRVWIVDPIDGTREFVSGTGDYVVSIGLAVDHEPVLGAVYAPARDVMYAGYVGAGVTRNGEPAGFSARPVAEAIVTVSDTEHTRELHAYDLPNLNPSGSIAYKLARIAAGEADATFTINPRSEWDIAAGHALVRAAGGDYTTRDGARIAYNQPRPRVRRGTLGGRPDVVAWLRGELARLAVPEQQQCLREGDAVYAMLGEEDARALRGHEHLHARHAGGRIEALVALAREGGTWRVTRAEGRQAALSILVKDLQREYGALDR